MLKKLLFDTLVYSIAPRLPLIVSFFILPITTQYLTPLDYGVNGVIMAYFGILVGFRELGLGVILTNTFYRHNKSYQLVWRNILGFLYIWGIVYVFAFGLLLYLVFPAEAESNKWLIMGLVLFPLLVFSPIERVANQYYQLKRKPIPISVISLSASFVGIAVSFYCIVYLQLGYLSWFISAFISNFISSSAYIYLMTVKHKFIPIFRFNISTFKRYLRIGLPVVPHQYASYLLNSSDRVVMDVMSVNNADLGKYNFAYTFGNMSQQMAQGVTTASRPYYMSILAGNKPDKLIEFRKLTFFLLKVFIAITFIGCLWLKEIFGILVNNDELRAMYPLAIIIIMSYNFTPMYQNASLVLSYNENTNALWKISLTAGILNVLLNFIFIPIYGYKVAAITTFATLLFLGFRGNFMKKYKEDQPLKNYSSAWIVALAGSTLLVYLLRDIHFSWKIGVSIIILIGLVLMYKRKYSNVFTSKLIG